MYEARQNKEKVSRRIDGGGGITNHKNEMGKSRNDVKQQKCSSIIQRLVVITFNNFRDVKEQRIWENAKHALDLSKGPLWDLQEHRSPYPTEDQNEEIRFVNHGISGHINISNQPRTAKDLYESMTADDVGINVLKNAKKIIFQSCFAGKDLNDDDYKDFNLSSMFANELKKLEGRNSTISVYGKQGVSYGFAGIGDAIDNINVENAERSNSHILRQYPKLLNSDFHKKWPWENRISTARRAASSAASTWQHVKKSLDIIDTIDGANEGWLKGDNVNNKYIRRYDLSTDNSLNEITHDANGRQERTIELNSTNLQSFYNMFSPV